MWAREAGAVSIAWTGETEAMRHVFGRENEVQKWLEFEAALARAEARHGIVPPDAAAEITTKARVELYDLDALRQDIAHAVHPIMPLVRRLAAACVPPAGEYVHWGATTQDVLDTALVLRLREADALIDRELRSLTDEIRGLAVRHRDTLMPGRTHGQHAVPITLGYKLAVWVDEFERHRRTLEAIRPTVFVGQFGGATGTLASLGPVGLDVRRDLMEDLGLGEPAITWHVSRDRFAHFASILAMIASAIQRSASEIIALQRTEIGEVSEPFHHGKVGSSTMPHKRNPAMSEGLWTLGELVRNDVRTAMSSLSSLHERDKAVYAVEVDYLPRVCTHTHRMLEVAITVFRGLTVDETRMRENVEASRGQLFSERVMMQLAERLGRQRAHDIVYNLAIEAFEAGEHLRSVLDRSDTVTKAFSAAELDAMFDLDDAGVTAGMLVDRVCHGGGSGGA
ncbi:MAG: adenylosuccinate lyase [Propionibacteriales bacterium]|nr:adenylosuccinate lyase [Propionibacteriales bacterium]